MFQQIVPRLWEMIEPILLPEDMELIELELKPGPRKILRIFIDKPGGVTLDDCAMISRQVSALLDIKDPIDGPYSLEVSSPGINRPLRKAGDFNRFTGSQARIKTKKKQKGRKNFPGILQGIQNESVVMEVDGEEVLIPLENIDKARLDIF